MVVEGITNLYATHKTLCDAEWDFEKNEKHPNQYPTHSNERVFWKCSRDDVCECHKWCAAINDRTERNKKCPHCLPGKVCVHSNLLTKRPDVAAEWDHKRNEKGPDQYGVGSNVKVFWICSNHTTCACHKWKTSIKHRTYGKGTGCPYCAKNLVCVHESVYTKHPHLVKEWHPDNKEDPKTVSSYSNKVFLWKCSNDGVCECHTWKSTVTNRTRMKSGCPYCAQHHQKACKHHNFAVLYPTLLSEWDFSKNDQHPTEHTPKSGKNVWWICSKSTCGCPHSWKTTIRGRTTGSGCPYCSNRKLCDHNNLAHIHPNIAKQWSEKNDKLPRQYPPGSSKKVFWKCDKGHEWRASISGRTGKYGYGCPFCGNSKHHSLGQIEWLKAVEDHYGIKIKTIEDGEEFLFVCGKKRYRLDGYCKIGTKDIAFEYDGCFWHGCTSCFNPENINKITKTTYSMLKDKTLVKKKDLEDAGFLVITMRECDYKKTKSLGCEALDGLLG